MSRADYAAMTDLSRQPADWSRDLKADLHCHSTASDGALAPAELVARAAGAGIRLLALTDHDTTAGLPEAAAAARQHGVQLISGVEISATWCGRVLHIVGLNFAPDCPHLRDHLAYIQTLRDQRAHRIAEKLGKAGWPDLLARVDTLARGGQITRSHFAQALVQCGAVHDRKQAFKRYLGTGKPGAVRSQWPEMQDAVNAIHAAGGQAVLAHPLQYRFSGAWHRKMLQAFAQAGGDAMETSCGAAQDAASRARLAREAQEHQLLASCGSDFHAPEQRWIPYGQLAPIAATLTPVWQAWRGTASAR